MLRNDIISFQRQEVHSRAIYILLVNAVFCIVTFIGYNIAKDEVTQVILSLAIIRLFVSLVVLSICFIAACKDMRFAELFWSALSALSLLATVLSNYFGLIKMDDELAMHELR